jgi:ADP-heptose:LPS heptosyltransferase
MDRWVGIPLVAVLSKLRSRMRSAEALAAAADGRRDLSRPVVTFLKSAAIGDTVLLSAVVRDLRVAWPDCHLRLACGTSNAPLARMVEGVDEVVVLPMSKPWRLWRMRGQLRSDVLIDFDSWPRINALLAFISRSGTTIGFRTSGQHRHALYDVVVDHSTNRHEVENYRQLVRVLLPEDSQAMAKNARPWLRLPSSPSPQAGSDAQRTVVFHMFPGGSQAPFKEWPADQWGQLAHELIGLGFQVCLTGGPADMQRNNDFVRRAGAPVGISVLQPTDLAPLAAWLREAAAVLTVDTGIAHLAGAVGAPTLVLHGPTSPQRWGALGPQVRYLKDWQAPWIELGFEVSVGGMPVQLTVQEVRDALLKITEDRNRSCNPVMASSLD